MVSPRQPRAARKRAGRRLSISLTSDQYRALLELAETNDVSLAWLARYALEELIQQTGGSQLKLPLHRA